MYMLPSVYMLGRRRSTPVSHEMPPLLTYDRRGVVYLVESCTYTSFCPIFNKKTQLSHTVDIQPAYKYTTIVIQGAYNGRISSSQRGQLY